MEIISFILNYFVTKDLSMMTAYICWTPEQISELYRRANAVGGRLAVVTDFHRPSQMSPIGRFREAMLLDLACPDAALILDKASSSRGFNYRHSWLLLNNSSYDSSVIEATLSDYDILPDADVVWASEDNLLDVYTVKPGKPYLQTNLGLAKNCSRQDLLSLWGGLPSVVSRRKDLRNVYLKGVSIVTKPEYFKGWSELRNRQIDTFPKLTYPLMMLAAEDLHFRFDLRQVDTYGVSHNGSFDGMAGLLQRHQAELGLASLFIRPDRLDVLHYFSETYVLSCAFIFRQPSRSAVSNVFLAPFSGGVWAATGVVAAAAALLLVALRRVRERTRPLHELTQLTLLDTCTFALGTLCQQGFHIAPAVTSVRVVMFSTLTASLFVFTAYSAKIVAILQAPSDALRSIDDLARSPMTIGVQDTTYREVYFIVRECGRGHAAAVSAQDTASSRARLPQRGGRHRARTQRPLRLSGGARVRVRHHHADVHGAREVQPQGDRGLQAAQRRRAHAEALRVQGAVRHQDALAARGGADGPRAARVAGGAAALRGGRRGVRQRRHRRRAARAADIGTGRIASSSAASCRGGCARA